MAIFHSHLQFCLDVTQAKPAKPKKEKKGMKPKTTPKRFSFVFKYLFANTYVSTTTITMFLPRFFAICDFSKFNVIYIFVLIVNYFKRTNFAAKSPSEPFSLDD